ncbi:MAG: hypothetical protein ABR547_02090 [Halanaerobium sp.]
MEPVLNKMAINAYDEKSNKLLFDPYLIKEYNGLKVGIIGIAATNIERVMLDWFNENTYFRIGKEELSHYIDKDKDKLKNI